MNDIDIMEQNLARLLNQHLSQPILDTTEPADPFQKRTFGKKLRKSAVSLIDDHRPASLPKPAEMANQVEDGETEAYMREVEVVLARLRVGLEKVEESCRERVSRICATSSGKQRQQRAEAALGELEASVDFILNDCFTFHPGKENRNDRDNRDQKHDKDIKKTTKKGVERHAEKAERQEKSIYESVLEERKMRRSKKRLI